MVRMEDLDRVTSRPEHEARQLADLAAIGLDWDGRVVRQSERFDLYESAIADLTRAGRTYPCFCTRREIAEAASAPHGAGPGRYPGTCRDLDPTRRRELEASGRPPALRLRIDDEAAAEIEFHDEIAGPTIGPPDDVVLRRNDGVPAYQLAVVVDDAAQGIELVVRGDDLLTSTPSQIVLGTLLGCPIPRFAHVPLVLSPDGQRLAKRDGAVTLTDRVALGDEPTDVVAWLASTIGLRGWDNAELVRTFDPTLIPRTPVVLSEGQLRASLRSAE